MTIFGQARLTRGVYIIVLLAMFAFDFAKGPIEHFMTVQQDLAIKEAMKPENRKNMAVSVPLRPGQNGDLQVLPSQKAMIDKMIASGRKPTPEEMEKFRIAVLKDAAVMTTGGPRGDGSVITPLAKRSLFEMLNFAAVILMTAVTVVGLLYMVSARLRDIGWPQYWLWVLLAPVFLPKFLGLSLPPLAVQAVTILFYGALLVLALVPGKKVEPDDAPPQDMLPEITPAMPLSASTQRAVGAKNRTVQFGRLGTR